MKKQRFFKTLLLTGFCLLPVTSVQAASWEHAVIETDHTFTITFTDNVDSNKQLLQNVTIFSDKKPVAYTSTTNGVTMTLDPTVNLQPSESYTVEVTLTTGETYKRDFLTKAAVETPVTVFIEQYPMYYDANILSTMQEQLEEVASLQAEGIAPDAALQAAVDAIPKQLQALEKIIANANAFKKNASKQAENATNNEFDVVLANESLVTLLDTHIETAPSLDVLTALQQTWTNAAALVTATEKANDNGLDLLVSLEDTNYAIADFIYATPFPSQASSAQIIKDLQKSFDANTARVTASATTITAQIDALNMLIDKAADYTFVADEATLVIEDITSYQQQFKSFENATAIASVSTTYKQFQTALNSISSKLASTSSAAALESTVTSAAETAENAVTKLNDLIDAYLEKEIEKLEASLEKVEQDADAQDINAYGLDSYAAASNIIYQTSLNYAFYDDTMTWPDIQQALKDASAAVQAVKDELKGL